MRSTGITVMVTVNLSMHCLSFVLVCTKKSCVMSNYIVTPRVCTTKVVSVNTITQTDVIELQYGYTTLQKG